MKVLFQEICSTRVNWDQDLEGKLLTTWKRLIAGLDALKNIQIPRCYFSLTSEDPVSRQLHGFCDASNKAFAAVIYLRTEHANGVVEVNFVASKTRVTPIKPQTIPRLELHCTSGDHFSQVGNNSEEFHYVFEESSRNVPLE